MTDMLKEGKKAPDFALPTDSEGRLSLADFKGRKVVLYFYPKDDTPGCTVEAQDFARLYPQFQKAGVDVLGVSKCSVKKHDKFKAKFCLPFPLLSDDAETCEAYGVWKEKSMYGKKYMGIERSTFLIGEDGKLLKIWPKVKIEGHAEEVLAAAEA